MNNKLLILIPFLLLIPSLSYAEIGYNYDKEIISISDDGLQTILWTSHYDRIWDGQEWVNYIAFEDSNIIKFDSANLSYEFNKNDCSFRLFEPLTNITAIEKYERTLSIDGSKVDLENCEVQNIEFLENELKITTKQNAQSSELKTIFNLVAGGSGEWTYEITNNDLFDSKFYTIIENCVNCVLEETKGDLLTLGTYILDTKNQEHELLKDITQTKDLSLTYETLEISIFEKIIIDPSFSETTTSDKDVADNGNNNVCDGGSAFNDDGTLRIYVRATAASVDCNRAYTEFNISSIPDGATITDTDIIIDVKTAEARTCDVWQMSSQPSAGTAASVFTDIGNGNEYISNNAYCTSTGDNKTVDLGTSADTDLSNLLTSNWFAVGYKKDNEVQDASEHSSEIDSSSSGTATPSPTLSVTYSNPVPSSPTAFNALAVSNTQINLSWTTPAQCYTGCTGYKIWRESPTAGGFSVLVLNTGTTDVTYFNTGLTAFTQYNYRVAAWNTYGLGSNSTDAADYTFENINSQVSAPTISIIGDVARLNGTIHTILPPSLNLTSIKLYVNGTLANTNGTNYNSTAPYFVNYGPLWYQMTENKVYNFTIQATVVSNYTTSSNTSKNNYDSWEYNPNYIEAEDPSQGTVNYTFVGDHTIQVNRDKDGATFSIECIYITQSNAFFDNIDNAEWDNETTTGYYTNDYAGFYYVTCYNDGELFTTILEQNYTNQLVPGLVIFDELGGFMGAPSVILVIIAILSLATGRNFPIIIIIAVSVTGILGAMGLVTFDPSVWAALIIIAGITLFGVRKFY